MPIKTKLFPKTKKIRRTGKPGGNPGNTRAAVHGAYFTATVNQLDGRSKVVRTIKAVSDSLMAALGGAADISPQQALLIDRVAFKFVKIALFEIASIKGQIKDGNSSSVKYLAWAESLRRDLQALGLDKKKKPVISLNDYIADLEKADPDEQEKG